MKKGILALLAFAAAAAASGDVVKLKDWAKSPEAYFLTPAERTDWAKLTSDDDAEKFIAVYWAKRGGDAFKGEISRRIAAADQQYKMRLYARGALSVRGRLLVMLGSPNHQLRESGGGVGGNIQTRDSNPDVTSAAANLNLTWLYDKIRFPADWGIGELRVAIVVDQARGMDEVQAGGAVEKALAIVAERSILNPAVQAVPAAPSRAAAAPAAAPAPAPVALTLPASARSILEAVGKDRRAPESLYWGAVFRTLGGDAFFAFELTIPAEKAAGGVKFGGVVLSESGEERGVYWEDAVLLESKTGTAVVKVYARSVTLRPGSYRGSFGLFPSDAGSALVAAYSDFKLEAPPEGLEVSPLLVTNVLMPLGKRVPPTEPFVFGKPEKPIQIIPKANKLFTNQDGLWYFYTVRNPAKAAEAPLAPASADATASKAPAPPGSPAEAPRPRIMATIGVLRDGKPAFKPSTAPAALELLGSETYGEGKEIPLEKFEPGFYTFVLSVRDLNAPRDSASWKGVERRGDFVVLKPDGSVPDKPAPEKTAPAPAPKAPAKKG